MSRIIRGQAYILSIIWNMCLIYGLCLTYDMQNIEGGRSLLFSKLYQLYPAFFRLIKNDIISLGTIFEVAFYYVIYHMTLLCFDLIGIRDPGSLIMGLKRKGKRPYLLRALVYRFGQFVLSPLIIFHLPAFIGGRGINEKWADFKWELKEGKNFILGSLLLFPALLFVICLLPLALNQFNHDFKIDRSDRPSQAQKIEGQRFDLYQHMRSNYFHLEAFSSLDDGRFILLPILSGEKSISKHFYIYDKSSKSVGELKKVTSLDLISLMKNSLLTTSPLLKWRYPQLAEVLAGGEFLKPIRYESGFNKKTLMGDVIKDEILEMLVSALELNFSTLSSFILNNGPFTFGHVRLKNAFLNKLGFAGGNGQIQLKKWHGHYFLQFLPRGKASRSVLFFDLSSVAPEVLELTFEHQSNSESVGTLLQDFEATLFEKTQWFFDYYEIFPIDRELVSAFDLFDVLPENGRWSAKILDTYLAFLLMKGKEVDGFGRNIVQEGLNSMDKFLLPGQELIREKINNVRSELMKSYTSK